MREADMQATIVEAARLHGWLVAHFRPAKTEKGWRTPMTGDPGFPDLVLVRPPRIIFAELKATRGRLSDAQLTWRASLEEASFEDDVGQRIPEVRLIRPDGLDAFLDELSGPAWPRLA